MDYEITTKKIASQDSNIKGFATIEFGRCFKIENIAIIMNRNEQLFVSMPKHRTNKVDEKNNPVFEEICNPITADFRKELYDNIIESFKSQEKITVKKGEQLTNPIYRVNVTPVQNEGSLIAMGSIVFDESFAVNGVIMRQKNDNIYVFMPTVKTGKVDAKGFPERKEVCHPSYKSFGMDLAETFKTSYNMKVEQQKNVTKKKNSPRAK